MIKYGLYTRKKKQTKMFLEIQMSLSELEKMRTKWVGHFHAFHVVTSLESFNDLLEG